MKNKGFKRVLAMAVQHTMYMEEQDYDKKDSIWQ